MPVRRLALQCGEERGIGRGVDRDVVRRRAGRREVALAELPDPLRHRGSSQKKARTTPAYARHMECPRAVRSPMTRSALDTTSSGSTAHLLGVTASGPGRSASRSPLRTAEAACESGARQQCGSATTSEQRVSLPGPRHGFRRAVGARRRSRPGTMRQDTPSVMSRLLCPVTGAGSRSRGRFPPPSAEVTGGESGPLPL